ncbi:ORF_041L [Frog virus 3]
MSVSAGKTYLASAGAVVPGVTKVDSNGTTLTLFHVAWSASLMPGSALQMT